MTRARPQADQALAVPAGPVARPSPSGFDPSRCRNCGGDGWVCENHPDAPWNDSMNFGCECGAGMPCGVCNLEMASAGFVERERERIATYLKRCAEVSPLSKSDFNQGVTRGLEIAAAGVKRRHDLAIATEAGTAETVEQGSVHEGAGPQDIAQPLVKGETNHG